MSGSYEDNVRFEMKAWLIGSLAAMVTFVVAAFVIGNDLNERNNDGARERTEQVEACSNIEDPTAALACVQEVNR